MRINRSWWAVGALAHNKRGKRATDITNPNGEQNKSEEVGEPTEPPGASPLGKRRARTSVSVNRGRGRSGRLISPITGTQFIDRLNENAQVMSKHFAQSFVDLSSLGFASQAVAKLGFDHRKGCFDV